MPRERDQTATTSNHSARDTAVGFYFQGLYGLNVLLDADDLASAIIEGGDDIQLDGPEPKLIQLKHSLGNPPPVNEHNDGFWKAIHNWITHLDEEYSRFLFVTAADVDPASPLTALTTEGSHRQPVVIGLADEALRVRDRRQQQQNSRETLSYKKRWPGCKAFLDLPAKDRGRLVERIRLMPSSFPAVRIVDEVQKRLRTIPLRMRKQVAARLIEWWDWQAASALIGLRERSIQKHEVLEKINDLSQSLGEEALPDDYGHRIPPEGEGLGNNLTRQIQLVGGGEKRISRATRDRWRARGQRGRWLEERLSNISELKRFDAYLEEAWEDRHEELREDCAAGRKESEPGGLELLDWTYHTAPNQLPPIRSSWRKPYLVHGSYQQMAEELEVGWHPDYRVLLDPEEPSEEPKAQP
jgi:hypothetical protein